jgi:alpha-beta hydrolase superfamily lysophospholipase
MYGREAVRMLDSSSGNVDTVYIIRGGNYDYFSKSVLGISHIHFLGKGMKCVEPQLFFKNGAELTTDMILSNIDGIHEIPLNPSEPFNINNIVCEDGFLFQPDTSAYRTNTVLFDSYFEDITIDVDDDQKALIINNTITYIPEGYVRFEVIHIRKQPYIIAKTNVEGVLYTEWFGFDICNRSVFDRVSKYAARGISTGAISAARGMKIGGESAARGITIGGEGALLGAKHGANGTVVGLESVTSGIGRAAYNESRMFYKPSRKIEGMGDLLYEERSIDVEKGITIYTYYFKSQSPKANVFFVHGNGGNVSTYKNMIQTLVSGNYNVYVVDWRGYGRSTGKPEYKGVLEDTNAAFDDFISLVQHDSLKMIVYGMSLGGQIATKLVSDRQEDIDAFILDGSLSSAQNLAMDFMPGEFVRNSMKRAEGAFNQYYIAERDIQDIINIPKLIIHSATDKIVSLYHGELLFKNARKPKFFWKTNTDHIKTLEELPDEAIYKIDRLIGFAK